MALPSSHVRLDGRSTLSRNNDLRMTPDPQFLHVECTDVGALSIVMLQLWWVINYDRWASIKKTSVSWASGPDEQFELYEKLVIV